MSSHEPPEIESCMVGRLKSCYWPKVFHLWTLERILEVEPTEHFKPDSERGDWDEDVAYHFGRIHHFIRCFRFKTHVDPIVVESNVWSASACAPPVWGPPQVNDGHHRFVAAVLTRRRRIPMSFGGLVTTCNWLTGKTNVRPEELQ